MRIRASTPADLPFLLELERRFSDLGFVGADDLLAHERAMADGDCSYCTIEVDGERSGHIVLRGLTSPHRSIEIRRIVMATPGGGVGRRALQSVIHRAFHEIGAHRVWLDVFVDNDRARHVYRSLGFVEEGTLRECVRVGERYNSLVIMSILEPEYREALAKAAGPA
jgi:diamine N-acetyltransferase